MWLSPNLTAFRVLFASNGITYSALPFSFRPRPTQQVPTDWAEFTLHLQAAIDLSHWVSTKTLTSVTWLQKVTEWSTEMTVVIFWKKKKKNFNAEVRTSQSSFRPAAPFGFANSPGPLHRCFCFSGLRVMQIMSADLSPHGRWVFFGPQWRGKVDILILVES